MTLSVSVALCTRDGSAFLEEQVLSILRQSRAVTEIVLSDDASTDGTVDLVARLVATRAPGLPLRILRNDPPLGIAGNFEQAIRACTSDLVALCDQDDVWAPDRMEILAAEFESDDTLLLVHTDARLIDDRGADLGSSLFETLRMTAWERRTIDDGRALDVYLRRNLVTGATTVFRRSLADDSLPIPPGWIHDEWLGIMAALLGRVAIVPGRPTAYRQHASNQIGVRDLGVAARIRKLVEPRTARNERLRTRSRSLVARLADLGDRLDARQQRLVRGKAAHEERRSALAPARIRRIGPVLRAWVGGDYRRYGRGTQDALRDLVQPT